MRVEILQPVPPRKGSSATSSNGEDRNTPATSPRITATVSVPPAKTERAVTANAKGPTSPLPLLAFV